MKLFIASLAALAVCASAGHIELAPGPVAVASSGSSSQFRSQDSYGNYQFGYDESHATGSTSRREERSGDIVRGSYRLGDLDGRARTVHYQADASGFHATIHTNEPGVDPSREPANVLINKEAIVAAPAPVLAAPAPLPAPLPAPVPAPLPVAPLPAAPVFRAPVFAVKGHEAPVLAGPVHQVQQVIEAPAPQAFSYSFGASHPVLSYAAPPRAPVAYAAPEPIYQQHSIKY